MKRLLFMSASPFMKAFWWLCVSWWGRGLVFGSPPPQCCRWGILDHYISVMKSINKSIFNCLILAFLDRFKKNQKKWFVSVLRWYTWVMFPWQIVCVFSGSRPTDIMCLILGGAISLLIIWRVVGLSCLLYKNTRVVKYMSVMLAHKMWILAYSVTGLWLNVYLTTFCKLL